MMNKTETGEDFLCWTISVLPVLYLLFVWVM